MAVDMIARMMAMENGEIEKMRDAAIENPENGEVLKYDAEQEKWVNGTASGGGGTSDYTDLINKPKINGVTLAGNKSLDDIGAADASDVDTLLSGKVDKVTGKGLSTEDYTTAEKTKLAAIEAGAEVNVQADWNQTTTTANDYIKNKPTIPAAQVPSDWTATYGVSRIINKPTLGNAATKNYTSSVSSSSDLVTSGAVNTALAAIKDGTNIDSFADVETALALKANTANLGTAAAADTTTSITSGGTGLPTSGTVYTDQQTQNSEIGSLVDRGAKNLIPDKSFKSSTGNNVSCTVNADGTATIKAMSVSGASSTAFFTVGSLELTPGTYVLSGGVSNDVWVYVPDGSSNWTSSGSATEKTFTTATTATVYIRVAQGFSDTTGVTVKPMICTKSDWAVSNKYKPYAPTNRELYIPTITAAGTMTNSTTITDTGVTVDIPADGGYWQIEGCITWKGSPPTEAQLRVNFGARNSYYLIARATNTNDDNKNFMYLPVSCTIKADPYYSEDADKTIHVKVWGKTVAATGNCEVCLIARRISAGF